MRSGNQRLDVNFQKNNDIPKNTFFSIVFACQIYTNTHLFHCLKYLHKIAYSDDQGNNELILQIF